MSDKITELLNQIDDLKELVIENIIIDKSFNVIQKLRLFYNAQLFTISFSTESDKIFSDWIAELETVVKESGKAYCITESILDDYLDRYETFLFHNIENVLENYIDSDYTGNILDYPEPIEVLRDRSSGIVLKKTPKEIINKIYNYAVEHRIFGYENDW